MGFIDFQSVSKLYNGRLAVCDFSLALERRERVVILGPSGCGKTTVLRLLAGLAAPDAGAVAIDGELVSADGRILKEPERRNLGMVFQDLALWPHLTVRGNLELGLKARGLPKQHREARIRDTLALLQIQNYALASPEQLSGGERQRVALARALVLEPQTLLLDEPLSSLNLELSLRLRREIVRLQNDLGFTLLYVTHNREEAFEVGTRLLVMEQGRVERLGSAGEIRAFLEDRARQESSKSW